MFIYKSKFIYIKKFIYKKEINYVSAHCMNNFMVKHTIIIESKEAGMALLNTKI